MKRSTKNHSASDATEMTAPPPTTSSLSDTVTIVDSQQKTCLGVHLWTLRKQNYFTDLALIGSDNLEVKGHLCVVAVASPLVKNHAADGEAQHRVDGHTMINVPNFTSVIIEHFVNFAYSGQVTISSESVRDLYHLADYFMDLSLLQAITNTVGNIALNVTKAVDVVIDKEPQTEYQLDEREEAEWIAAMEKKTPGRRKVRIPKKNIDKAASTPASEPVLMPPPGEPSSNATTEQQSPQMTRIKRKSAVKAKAKWQKATKSSAKKIKKDTDSENAAKDADFFGAKGIV